MLILLVMVNKGLFLSFFLLSWSLGNYFYFFLIIEKLTVKMLNVMDSYGGNA